MAEAGAAHRVPLPWALRVFEALPLPPACVGIGISTGLLAVYFGVEYASGQIDRVMAGEAAAHIPAHFLATVVNAALLGYLPTAQLYLARGTRRHLAELSPLLQAPADRAAGSLRHSEALGSPRSVVAGFGGVLLVIVLFMVLPADLSRYLQGEYWIFEHTWDNVLLLPLGWMTGRFVYAIVADSFRFSRLAGDLGSIDLFDLRPLAPFARQGLLSALLAILFISIGSAHVWNLDFVIDRTALALALGGVLTFGATALVLPVIGVRRRIRREKRARLETVRSAIQDGEKAAVQGNLGAAAVAGLPGLLALEARIAGVREWPFDAPTLLRFALYLGLGLGSWLGAAAVERLLDQALG